MDRESRNAPYPGANGGERRASRRVAATVSAKDADEDAQSRPRGNTSRNVYNNREEVGNNGAARFNSNRGKHRTSGNGSSSSSSSNSGSHIDFGRLEMRSLLRYKRHFKLPVAPQANKIELIQAVRKHFNQPLFSMHYRDSTGATHEHAGAMGASGQALTEPDIIASFLHVSARYLKFKNEQKAVAK